MCTILQQEWQLKRKQLQRKLLPQKRQPQHQDLQPLRKVGQQEEKTRKNPKNKHMTALQKLATVSIFLSEKTISYLRFINAMVMPTWNCKDCDMPIKLVSNETVVRCPHCGKSMFQIADSE